MAATSEFYLEQAALCGAEAAAATLGNQRDVLLRAAAAWQAMADRAIKVASEREKREAAKGPSPDSD